MRHGLILLTLLLGFIAYQVPASAAHKPPMPPKHTEKHADKLLLKKLTDAELTQNALAESRDEIFSKYNQSIILTKTDKPINIGLFANVDFIPKRMKKTLPGEEGDYLALANARINIAFDLTKWVHSHVGVAYYHLNKGQANVFDNINLILDDAYIYFSNMGKNPVFIQAGRFYLPFSFYDRYTIVPTLVQVLSETREDGVQVGILNFHGVSASAYLTQGVLRRKVAAIQGNMNSGLSVTAEKGFHNDTMGVGGGFQVMQNMLNTNALSQSDAFFGATPSNTLYSRSIPGLALQGHVRFQRIRVFADFVTALKRSKDLILRYADIVTKTDSIFGAMPSAWDVGVVIESHLLNRLGEFNVNYQRSSQTAGIIVFNAMPFHSVPKTRYELGYTVYVMKNVTLRLQYVHNILYAVGAGDSGRQGDAGTLRLGVNV